MVVKIEEFYINGAGPRGEGQAVPASRQDLHRTIDKFLDMGCTVITITKGKPGAP